MEKEVQTWLEDIKQAIEEIELFLPEKLNFFEFQKDLKGRKAIERNIGDYSLHLSHRLTDC